MANYTNSEMADMHFIYGLANGNAREARRLYMERYPNRMIPDHRIFSNIHRRLGETGTFKKNTNDAGKPRTVRTPQIEEIVLNEIDRHPRTSTRRISEHLNISHQVVWRILRASLLYPYHIQRVQALLPRDFPLRIDFCQWYLNMLAVDRNFDCKILFTDEANFSRTSIKNFHNNHTWADENPHEIVETHFQEQFSLNVWGGIIGDNLIGPCFLPGRLTGQSYRLFLQNELPLLLEDLPLLLRNQMWYMHDGAPSHFSILAREYLNEVYENRWIGRGGPQPWPPRSPDLNSLDFFMWGHLKSLVYTTPLNNVDDLRNRIINGFETIRNTPGVFERVRASMRRRADACIRVGGGHFQQLL